MGIVKSLSKPEIEILESTTALPNTAARLKINFNVEFNNESGIYPPPEGTFHSRYGTRVEVNGYPDSNKLGPNDHKRLFYFQRTVLRWVPSGSFSNLLGGSFEEATSTIFLLPSNEDLITKDGPLGQTIIGYPFQSITGQEVTFDMLDVNPTPSTPFGSPPEEKDILFVRLFIIDSRTGHVVKEARSDNFSGFFELGIRYNSIGS